VQQKIGNVGVNPRSRETKPPVESRQDPVGVQQSCCIS